MKLLCSTTVLFSSLVFGAKSGSIKDAQWKLSKEIDEFLHNQNYEVNGHNHTNTIYSPLSIYTILSALYLGTGDEEASRKELQEKFGFKEKFDKEKYLKNLAKHQFTPALRTFNSYLLHKDVIGADYRETLEQLKFTAKKFDSLVDKESEINEMIAKDTDDMIKDFFSDGSFTSETALVLLNTILFKDSWETENGEFHKRDTKTIPAWAPYKTESDHADKRFEADFMLSKKRKFRVFYDDMPERDYVGYYDPAKEALREQQGILHLWLKFSTGCVMTIVMPKQDNAKQAHEIQFSDIPWSEFKSPHSLKTANLLMPKFEVENSLDIKKFLKAKNATMLLGANSAGLTKMFDSEEVAAYVGSFDHKAVIKVHEKGAEAAAASGAKVILKSIPRKFRTYRVNRPFKYFIHHPDTKIIYFTGVVNCPANNCDEV